MISRKRRVAEIQKALRRRRLIFFGTRGADAETLLELDGFAECFSLIAPLGSVAVKETCLETLTGERVDLDRYNPDHDRRPVMEDIRHGLLKAFGQPAAVVPYRPCATLASCWFPRSDRVKYLGVFHEKQAAFEHKPWVERQLADRGIRTVPWKYYADREVNLIGELLAAGPFVLRANRSDGGAGLTLIRDRSELAANCPEHADGFLAASPFLKGNTSFNVNACVFPSGVVTRHPASIQLVGLKSCTRRTFGYCGNDFAAFSSVDQSIVDELDTMVEQTGAWLHEGGYRGAFGIDVMLWEGEVYLTEVNPRFQGSTLVSARIDRELERPDLYMDHIAAYLGLAPADQLSLREMAECQPPMAHVICHNTTSAPIRAGIVRPDELPVQCRLLPAQGISVQPEAILFQAVFGYAVTQTGLELAAETEARILGLAGACG